jgi:hypothetical protein
MIIDVHYHLVAEKWFPDEWWATVARMYVHGLKALLGIDMSLEEVRERLISPLWDPEGETLIRDMDAAGIDKTVILPLDYWALFGEPKGSLDEQHKAYADLQDKHPNRIIAFATVDPRRPDAVEIVERAFKEWGLKGLDLYPQTGFLPNQRETYRVLETVCELGVPVLCHTGEQDPAPFHAKYGDPLHLDDVVIDFPNLMIIASAMSFGWHQRLFYLASLKYNLATDISAWQDVAKLRYPFFCQVLRQAIDRLGAERVLFGTDNPFVSAFMTSKEYVELIKELPQKATPGTSFTEAEVRAILGENAARILCH